MKASLFRSNVWSAITAAVKQHPTQCRVAVAYFGKGGAKILPLKRGSTLVVDLSEATLKSGQTYPKALKELVRKGVRVFPAQNLHAKVFVVGRQAFVGSCNVSDRSACTLCEAVVRTTAPAVVAEAREFVRSLCGDAPVGPAYLDELQKLYRDPRVPGRKAGAYGKKAGNGMRMWYIRSVGGYRDEEDARAERDGTKVANRRLTSEEYVALGGGSSQAFGINNRGDIVGSTLTSAGGHTAFVYIDGRMSFLVGTFSRSSVALSINDHRQAVGYADYLDGTTKAFVTSGINATLIPALGAPGKPPSHPVSNDGGQGAIDGMHHYPSSERGRLFIPGALRHSHGRSGAAEHHCEYAEAKQRTRGQWFQVEQLVQRPAGRTESCAHEQVLAQGQRMFLHRRGLPLHPGHLLKLSVELQRQRVGQQTRGLANGHKGSHGQSSGETSHRSGNDVLSHAHRANPFYFNLD